MRCLSHALLFGLLSVAARAEMKDPIPLWRNGAPGALGHEPKDVPAIIPYIAEARIATGSAMIICPGGGYNMLADHEGHDYALWLNQHGVTAFVLRYRLASGGYHHPAMLNDAARAVRLVRANAAEWKVDPHRVGIMGSSAGGHLAATLITQFSHGDAGAADPVERQSSRPDLGILCYAVITLGPLSEPGTRLGILGGSTDPTLVALLSNERQVKSDSPPCFIWHPVADHVVPVENSLQFATALRRAGVQFELHIHEQGRHGIGLDDKPPFAHVHPWANECLTWLKGYRFVQ